MNRNQGMSRLSGAIDLDLSGKDPLRRFFIEKKGPVFCRPLIQSGPVLEGPFIEGHKSEINLGLQ